MSDEISFGEIQRAQPNQDLRPDQNPHFGVFGVGNPQEGDLPIFVDLDTVKEMEEHAVEDTSIELGGVLLGKQLVDNQGQPFVIVNDSLRAQHYQATQSSFTFTHETWETICKQKDQFPPGTEIVGWYHTHPDFGIFLSGMDMFICNGFFNAPLDVALVIDPIRQDRGWFHWTSDQGEKVKRQTGGYYLFSSRFRTQELEVAANQLVYKDPAMRGVSQVNQQPNTAGSTVQVIQSDQNWSQVAIVSSLAIQTIILAGIFFMIYKGGGLQSTQSPQIAQARAETQAATSILKKIASEKLPPGQTLDLNSLIKKEKKLLQEEQQYHAVISNHKTLQDQVQKLVSKVESQEKSLSSEKLKNEELSKKYGELSKLQKDNEAFLSAAREKGWVNWWTNPWNIVLAGGVVVLAAIGGLAGGIYFFTAEEQKEPPTTIS